MKQYRHAGALLPIKQKARTGLRPVFAGLLFILTPFFLYSQQWPSQYQPDTSSQHKKKHNPIGIGIKAGLNFSNITNASMINSSSATGYHFGIFLAPPSKRILSSRTELIYSRHGFNYSDSTTSGSVALDYIMLAQLMAINITKYVQIQVGGQTGYLLQAKSTGAQQSTGNASTDQLLKLYSRFDYGFGAGIELHPYGGILIGARYNISLSSLYNSSFTYSGNMPPSYAPGFGSLNLKNNVVQLFLGYRF